MNTSDTIAAISSAVGPAARMIVRASGPGATGLARGIADPAPEAAGSASRYRLSFASLTVPAWVYVFRAPRSYTGEDLVEFHLPGNPLLARMLLDHFVRSGARHADAGEFTARAYFNGRIDLTAAEGVAATIAANSDAELRAARQLLSGELARRLRPAMDRLAETLALVEVGIDFSGEDVTFLPPSGVQARVGAVAHMLDELVAGSVRFDRLAHEPTFVLVGRPNAGKSTLLNALAGRERAVVSPTAGTTRDVLSAEVALERGLVRVLDVAGLEPVLPPPEDRSPQAGVARQMHRRALAAVESADFVVLVKDITDPAAGPELPREPALIIHTKADLPHVADGNTRLEITVSAATGLHLDRLRRAMGDLAFASDTSASLALNARHLAALADARAALDRASVSAATAGAEILAVDLREALDVLGGILGVVTPDDLLGRIFSAFCIGK